MNSRQLPFYITTAVAAVPTSKQESAGKDEPVQFSPPHCLWAAAITSNSWDPFQKTEAEHGLNPSPSPLQQAFHTKQSRAYAASY